MAIRVHHLACPISVVNDIKKSTPATSRSLVVHTSVDQVFEHFDLQKCKDDHLESFKRFVNDRLYLVSSHVFRLMSDLEVSENRQECRLPKRQEDHAFEGKKSEHRRVKFELLLDE